MPSPIPEETREAVLSDIEAGQKSRGQIARDNGVSTTTVSKVAKDAGIESPFSRENTQKATEAAVADAKSRRATLARDSLAASTEALAALRQRIENMSDRDLITLFGVAADKHLAFDRHDSGTHGLAAVDAWLDKMMGQ